MRHRAGNTLIEVLVVVAIIAVLIAMLLGGLQKVRMAASRVTCANQMRQIGLAMHAYDGSSGTLPRARHCPDWKDGTDPDCNTLVEPLPASTYTGPNEAWWAPYDNRDGTTPTKALGDDNFNHGPLWGLLSQDARLVQCPDGIDKIPDSPTKGQRFQVSYGMNFVTRGPSGQRLEDVANGNGIAYVMLVWDHANTPACSVYGFPRPPVQPFVQDNSKHYPARHGGCFNVLFCDGHVATMRQEAIQESMFVMN